MHRFLVAEAIIAAMFLCIPLGTNYGCSARNPAIIDGGKDAGLDSGLDGGTDGGETDGGIDSGFDGGGDGGADGGTDGGGCNLPPQASRLRIVNGCTEPIWIFFTGTNNSTIFYWTTANATSCTLNGGGVPINSDGGYAVRLTETTSYTLSCSGTGGPISQTATVVVNPMPLNLTINSFQATPISADPVIEYTLSIATANATSCDVDNSIGSVPTNGSQVIAAPLTDTTYTLTCQGTGGPATAQALVVVQTDGGTDVKFTSFSVSNLAITYGGNLINATNHKELASTCDYVDYNIPDGGLAGMRFWPGLRCDGTGNNCAVGQSGGPAVDGFTCPSQGCAPSIDSKFEGTFGCLDTVPTNQCQVNPSEPSERLPTTDSWDTSNVDGFTFPYKVKVLDACAGGPPNGIIDCSQLSFSNCPTDENASTPTTPPLPVPFSGPPDPPFPQYGSLNLILNQLADSSQKAGCYSPCSKLTISNQGNNPGDAGTVVPADNRAAYYCCEGPVTGACNSRTATECPCAFGPVVNSKYVEAIHQYCPNVYAFGYDDGEGLWSCPAGTRYEVTFNCPQ